jgi:hypothetical protein
VLAELAQRGVTTGLYASGFARDHHVARRPSSSPDALPAMLELLARATPFGPSLAELMIGEGGRLGAGTSVIVVAADFTEQTVVAMAEMRRRFPVTALWVATDQGNPPPAEQVDVSRKVQYVEGWRGRDVVEIGI